MSASIQGQIVGWSHTRFGRLDGQDLEALIRQATREAIEHAGVDPAEIGAVYVGHFNAGMVADGFVSSMPLQEYPQLRFAPATRVENACASGSAALYQALAAVQCGQARYALVVGAEKMFYPDKKTEMMNAFFGGTDIHLLRQTWDFFCQQETDHGSINPG